MSLLYIGLTLFYIIILVAFAIYFKNKKYVKKEFPEYAGPVWISNLNETLFNDTFEVDTGNKARSIINLAIYFFCFEVLAGLVSSLMISIWLNKNGYAYETILSTSANYDEAVYKQMYNDINILLQITIYLAAIIPVIILSRKEFGKDIINFKTRYLIYGAVGLGFLYIVNISTSIIFSLIGVVDEATNEQSINEILLSGGLNTIIMSICTVLLAPILEELVFRKCIFNLFPNDNKLALVVSSLLFGSIHVISPCINAIANLSIDTFAKELVYLIQYSSMGLVLGLVYIRSSRNITSSLFAHFLNNAISLAATLLLL